MQSYGPHFFGGEIPNFMEANTDKYGFNVTEVNQSERLIPLQEVKEKKERKMEASRDFIKHDDLPVR